MNIYEPNKIEQKWQKRWKEKGTNKIDLDTAQKPFYNLMMFPYPSAEGLHIGSVYTFTGIDTYGRFKRMQGYDVFEPIGLDGFGIHSENFAIKIGEHIKDVSKRTEKHFYEQLYATGNMFDWDRTVETYKPDYYKWTQWLFVQLFKAGYAYRKEADVNWCPSCKTVLSDEQVIDDKCERCGNEVIKKSMNQWFFKITDFSERLLNNLDELDWSEDVKTGQRNWIGKRTGINIEYQVEGIEEKLVCFTTTPVNFGATFIVVAPEHPLLDKLIKEDYREEAEKYIEMSINKTELERQIGEKDKTGVFTGSYAINHLTGDKLPIWVADFVLAGVGTGAVQGCPAHDERDFDFAKKFGIQIIRVVESEEGKTDRFVNPAEESVDPVKAGKGVTRKMVNSEFLNGLPFDLAMEKTKDYFEEHGWGKRVTSYNLRDWCVSRQRYWGPPIPMIFCKHCEKEGIGYFPEEMSGWWPEENLPVLLPEIEKFEDILPDGSGLGPLAKQENFVNVLCPHCGGNARRETDVSDPFVDSCWYFLRYPFTERDDLPFGGDFEQEHSLFRPETSSEELTTMENRMQKWGPVTSYIGGKEHTVLHLLYARFITMVLRDLGYINFEEPFTRFYGHGLITKDGAKMSKSKGNVINPDEYFEKYGADAVRMYLRFMGPFDQGGDWSDRGMKGMSKFVHRIYTLFSDFLNDQQIGEFIQDSFMHKTIKLVAGELNQLKFNTAVAKIMELVNWYQSKAEQMPRAQKQEFFTNLTLILAPLMPHLAEEFWEMLGNTDSVHTQLWPSYDESKVIDELVTYAIQVSGKLRGSLEVRKDLTENEVVELAKQVPNVAKYLETNDIRKTIFVPEKIINFIV